ncbi:Gfo/Idh/MocA family oxidoreductase [Halorarum halophilum]|uniref:Gfo/Idh/MocA family oxidoreductase n=1 Tax=Halorarum halophilum TaxID=2743090 RepID=A0A7D5KUD7_9EURY|nr:Gfo/Idh/MocA family oxidoreductase [Halobaculum halophilum]QLG27340.1 Gfo/Idh/MocA family oxidoreductase [Halobaculum halophilum]
MTYRAGIIGAGGIAGLGILGLHDEEDIGTRKFPESHAGGYHATEDIDLVAVADVDEGKLDTFGEAWDLPPERRYVGHEAMLAAEELDVVSVCTPSFLHHQHVLDAARSSADPDVIWCEKPIASGVGEAEEMCEVCAETDTELVINHSFRFTDKLRTLRDHVRDGLIGEVKAVTAQFRRELLRNSTHLIDTLVYLLDARPRRVSGFINGENDAVTALEGDREVDDSGGGGFVVMDDGTFVSIDCTVARDISSMTFQLVGTEGKLYINNDDGEWRYWALEDGAHVEKPIPGIEDAWRWDEDYRGSFANAARHVADLLNGEAENRSPGEEAARSVEVIVGFYISHYTGGHVSVPFDRPLKDVTITSW